MYVIYAFYIGGIYTFEFIIFRFAFFFSSRLKTQDSRRRTRHVCHDRPQKKKTIKVPEEPVIIQFTCYKICEIGEMKHYFCRCCAVQSVRVGLCVSFFWKDGARRRRSWADHDHMYSESRSLVRMFSKFIWRSLSSLSFSLSRSFTVRLKLRRSKCGWGFARGFLQLRDGVLTNLFFFFLFPSDLNWIFSTLERLYICKQAVSLAGWGVYIYDYDYETKRNETKTEWNERINGGVV